MNGPAPLDVPALPPMIAVDSPSDRVIRPRGSRWKLITGFIWKLGFGMLACLSPLGAFLVVGWSYRLAQRYAVQRWFKFSRPKADREARDTFLAADPATAGLVAFPNWFVDPTLCTELSRREGEGQGRRLLRMLKTGTRSLRRNFWFGLQGAFNTWVFTLPGCVLWWFGWYDGWQNSFNKGYEQSFVGPAVSFIGIFAFIAAMYDVPMAQARQAVTGNWKSFYNFRLVWNVVRHRWLASAFLAAFYVLASIPATIFKTAPMFWAQNTGVWENATDAEVLKSLNHYFFWCSLYFFPVFAILRVIAARIYASAVVEGIQDGWICHESLGSVEASTLERLGLIYPQPPRARHPVVRAAVWAGTRLGRATTYTALFFIWFAFVAQLYISEFLKYNSGVAWLNQPLVQLPWFLYMPTRIQNPLMQVLIASLVVLAAGVVRKLQIKLTLVRSSNRTPIPVSLENGDR